MGVNIRICILIICYISKIYYCSIKLGEIHNNNSDYAGLAVTLLVMGYYRMIKLYEVSSQNNKVLNY